MIAIYAENIYAYVVPLSLSLFFSLQCLALEICFHDLSFDYCSTIISRIFFFLILYCITHSLQLEYKCKGCSEQVKPIEKAIIINYHRERENTRPKKNQFFYMYDVFSSLLCFPNTFCGNIWDMEKRTKKNNLSDEIMILVGLSYNVCKDLPCKHNEKKPMMKLHLLPCILEYYLVSKGIGV